MTVHRPSNVDDPADVARLITAIGEAARGLPVVFPVHPRTAKTLTTPPFRPACLLAVEPQPYQELNYLMCHARGVTTDSGGIPKETTVLGIPSMTLRNSTKRSETVTLGTNDLIGTGPAALKPAPDKRFAGQKKKGTVPDLCDGRTDERVAAILERQLARG